MEQKSKKKKKKKEEHRSRTNTPTLSSVIVSPEKEEGKKHTKQQPPAQNTHNQANKPKLETLNAAPQALSSPPGPQTFTLPSALFRQPDPADGKETQRVLGATPPSQAAGLTVCAFC